MLSSDLRRDVWWHCCCSILVFSVVLNAIPIPFIPFRQMSEECYDKTFILNIIDSSHLPWKGLVHWSSRWDRCLISVYSVLLKWAAPCDHLRKLSALAGEGEVMGDGVGGRYWPPHCSCYHTRDAAQSQWNRYAHQHCRISVCRTQV